MGRIFFALILSLLLTACGGGGGGSSSGDSASTNDSSTNNSSSGNTQSLSYTGKTDPAPISVNNAEKIAGYAYSLGATGASAVGNLSITDKDGFKRQGTSSRESGYYAQQTYTWTKNGSCGGTAESAYNYDTSTNIYTGTITYSDYCNYGDTTDGTVTYTWDLNDGADYIYAITYDSLTVTDNDTGQTDHTSGTIEWNYGTDPDTSRIFYTTRQNIVYRDAGSSQNYKLENYVYRISFGGANSSTIYSINGDFYHPTYGKVTVATLTDFERNYSDTYPNTGQMTLTGANNSSVRITAVDASTYHEEVDTDGDGVYETDNGNKSWSKLDV